jgi:hypothetical protein
MPASKGWKFKVLSDELVRVRVPEVPEPQVWALAKLRKDATCEICQRTIAPGTWAWRPRGNGAGRILRVCHGHFLPQPQAFTPLQQLSPAAFLRPGASPPASGPVTVQDDQPT